MNRKMIFAVIMAASFSVMFTACNNSADGSATVQSSAEAAASETTATETTLAESTAAESSVGETAEAEIAAIKAEITWETIAPGDVEASHYEITNGTWFYKGVEDEKSIDMDGMKGFTLYTAEAIPENEGYLQFLGVDPNGQHVFDVYDLYGRYFMRMTFVSEEQFYIDDDESNYYVKWDY